MRRRGRVIGHEGDHLRADGEIFPVEVLLTAVREAGRRTLHVVWRDITERKALEDRLRQAQKMEAVFTTKELGQGTGLGLATAYGIITQSGGRLELHSSPEAGTEVEILLPTTDEAPTWPCGRSPQRATMERGSETVLVAEDDPVVSILLQRVLREQGYTVLTASDGHQAYSILRSGQTEVQLLISDVIMPKLGGPALVEKLRAASRCPPVLFVSGYTDGALDGLEKLTSDVDLLEKPFDAFTLTQRVRAVLDKAGEHRDSG